MLEKIGQNRVIYLEDIWLRQSTGRWGQYVGQSISGIILQMKEATERLSAF